MPLIPSTNPSRHYEVIDSVESTTPEAIVSMVADAHKAQKSWKNITITERVAILDEIYQSFVSATEELAQSIAREMGMPVHQARDEVNYGLLYFRWYLDHAEEYLKPQVTRENATELHTVYHEPK